MEARSVRGVQSLSFVASGTSRIGSNAGSRSLLPQTREVFRTFCSKGFDTVPLNASTLHSSARDILGSKGMRSTFEDEATSPASQPEQMDRQAR